MNETELINYLKKNIIELIPSLEITKIETNVEIDSKKIDMIIKTKERDTILIEVKSSGEPSYIFKAISQLKYYQSSKNEYLMVAVPNISEKSKAICKSSGIGYIDLEGKTFIKYKKILIDKTQDRNLPLKFSGRKKRVSKIFSKNSFRVLVNLLKRPAKYFTQEELTRELGISRAYINRILKTLENGIKVEGSTISIEETNRKETITGTKQAKSSLNAEKQTKKYKLTNPDKLLDVLAKEYEFSKNEVISLYSFERNPAKLMNRIAEKSKEKELHYAFTQHAGASLVAPFTRFEDIYFYVHKKDIPKWIESLDLKRTELGGNVFLIVPQYKWMLEETTEVNRKRIICNIILYLDLINYPKRGKEQAGFLREKKIGF